MSYSLKKSLGQHFLNNEAIAQKIVQSLQQAPFQKLLEIGPGAGALTKYLLQIPNIELKLIEIDEEKIHYLLNAYPLLRGKMIHQDFLKATPPFEDNFAIIGNFPYNISSQIVFKILQWKQQVNFVTGMFQKEVAQRIAAQPGSKVYGIISVLVQAFYNVSYLFDVPPQCFTPPPKVNSSVVQFFRKEAFPAMKSETHFFTLVKAAFNQRRKILKNATAHLFQPNILTQPLFLKRAEQLSVEEFAQLTFMMNNIKTETK
jgi:16S rRNA (adenine1518-N6/adenine1519-N6)-dimethyltransferase